MKLSIVYDNETISKAFEPAWGFSCIIELDDEKIIFDTGWDGNILLSNMELLGYHPRDISKVILSHGHWDHIGGLTSLTGDNHNLTVYATASLSNKLKAEISNRAEVVEISKQCEITTDVFSTGELGSGIKEQSLIIKNQQGSVVITGCAHSGLENIISNANQYGEIYSVMGGFHGFKDYRVLEGIPRIMPCHCTVNKAGIKMNFRDAFVKCGAGTVMEI